ncbi:DNA polymerase III subunit delta [Paramicrobacterium agarici]|uniref:DNA-directed DNA polymerase n=1 Tax=Paramicrobacterium agarici TaxID=630514 RepID=A0A2A9DX97_9MICO|nr:DNA polymerase III subunit delta [Microbacterium agarici]PFG31204.1 DNA polymerase III delta subunit [Microbacterium agarici]
MAATRRGATAKSSAKIPQLPWHDVRPAPVVLVSGPQDLFADRAIKGLRDFLRAEDPSLEINDIEAAAYQPGELVTLASPSLFAEPRLIRVSGVEKCTDAFLSEAIEYLAAPAESAYLVLRHAGGMRGKKLLDAVRAASGAAIEIVCNDIKKDAEKFDFAKAEFARANKRITPGALRQVVSAFSDDVAELAAACQQLIADSADQITEGVVDRYYGGRVETTAFAVADIALAGRTAEALVGLRHALDSGADPVPVVAAFAMKVRAMAKVANAHGSSAQLASSLGMAPWQVDRARRDARGWTDEGLGRAILALAEADAAVKGAERDPVFAVERLIGVIASRGGV